MVTTLAYATAGTTTTVHIAAGNGTFSGAPITREHRLWLRAENAALPKEASCDGIALKKTAAGTSPGFWLDGGSGVVVACDPKGLVSKPHTVVVAF